MRKSWIGTGLLVLLAAALVAAQDRGRPAVVEWAPDGKILIASNGLLARFDFASGEETLLARRVDAFALNPDGTRLALGGSGGLELRRYPGFEAHSSPPLPGPVAITALAFPPDIQTLAAGTAAGHLLLWDLSANELWADLNVAPPSPVERLRFSADGRRLLSTFEDGRAVLWDLERREEVHRYALPRNPQGELEGQTIIADLSPDGRLVLATRLPEAGAPEEADADPEMVLLDDRGRVRWRRAGYAMEFTRDAAGVLALAPPFRIAALYQTADAAALRIFEPPEEVTTLYLVRQSPDGKLLVGVGEDHLGQVLILWDFSTAEVLRARR